MGTASPPKMSHTTYTRSEVMRGILTDPRPPQSLEARVTENLGSIQRLTNLTHCYSNVFLDDDSAQFTRIVAEFRDSECDLIIDIMRFEQAVKTSFFSPSCLARIASQFVRKYTPEAELERAERDAETAAAVCASNLAALQALGLDMHMKLQALAKAQQDVNEVQASFIPLASASIQANAESNRTMIRLDAVRRRQALFAQPDWSDPLVGVKRPREFPAGQ